MRGIRIWHLAALALSVPFLTAAVPTGCTGGLNPSFRNAIGQDAGSGIAIPKGYILVGIFNESSPQPGVLPGYTGYLDMTVQTPVSPQGWRIGFDGYTPRTLAWACDVLQIGLAGGVLYVPDPTGAIQQETITYDGPALSGNLTGNALECGTVYKIVIRPGIQPNTWVADVDLVK